jgi:hypothetical protein
MRLLRLRRRGGPDQAGETDRSLESNPAAVLLPAIH